MKKIIKAPGEAEAGLAQLNAEGVIDAILSDDVDCFLFGAQTVLRSVKGNSKSKYMEHLNIYDIRKLENFHFSREELVFIALLRGGDYDRVRSFNFEAFQHLRAPYTGSNRMWHYHCCKSS